MRRSTKAQIQVGETVAVILIFIVLMLFGLYWLTTASTASNTQRFSAQDRTDLLETAKLVMSLPELHCSTAGVVDSTCVDEYRVLALQEALDNDQTVLRIYQDRFIGSDRGAYSFVIIPLYGEEVFDTQLKEITEVFDFTSQTQEGSRQAVSIPLVVHNPITGTHTFGVGILTQEVMV